MPVRVVGEKLDDLLNDVCMVSLRVLLVIELRQKLDRVSNHFRQVESWEDITAFREDFDLFEQVNQAFDLTFIVLLREFKKQYMQFLYLI